MADVALLNKLSELPVIRGSNGPDNMLSLK
jgi:hypothetical protein